MSVVVCFWCETLTLIVGSMKYADRAKRVRDNSFFPKSLEVCLLVRYLFHCDCICVIGGVCSSSSSCRMSCVSCSLLFTCTCTCLVAVASDYLSLVVVLVVVAAV